MNPIQESKQELKASIRYAENAIAKAKQAIEQTATYQEQTGREKALDDENIHLQKVVIDLETFVEELRDDKVRLNRKVETLERDLTVKTANANAWKKEADKLRHKVCEKFEPTMPVIPKDVAIAIFREGLVNGAEAVATELDNACDIEVSDRECMGNFEVEYTQYIDLSDHLDTDWLRSKTDEIGETFVLDCLSNLCADNKFECRIHGVDDTTIDLTKKNNE